MKSTSFGYLRFGHTDKNLSTNLQRVISYFFVKKRLQNMTSTIICLYLRFDIQIKKNPEDEFLIRVTSFFLFRKDLKNDKDDDLVTYTIGCSNKRNPINEYVNRLILIF